MVKLAMMANQDHLELLDQKANQDKMELQVKLDHQEDKAQWAL